MIDGISSINVNDETFINCRGSQMISVHHNLSYSVILFAYNPRQKRIYNSPFLKKLHSVYLIHDCILTSE